VVQLSYAEHQTLQGENVRLDLDFLLQQLKELLLLSLLLQLLLALLLLLLLLLGLLLQNQ